MINGKKDFIDLSHYQKNELITILNTALDLKRKSNTAFKPLAGKTLGMIFAKSSTRTRVSFEAGMQKLGGKGIFLSQNDLQLGRGEPLKDTAMVLERYLDALMIRTYKHKEVVEMARYSTIPVINGLTDFNHPCQVMADLLTIYEKKGKFNALKMAYCGDGNNIANSLAVGAAKIGLNLHIATPLNYECNPEIIKAVQNSTVTFSNDPRAACEKADIIYTDVWISMGQEQQRRQKLHDFTGFQINNQLVEKAADDYIFMHCLPAHRGEEVSAAVIDSSHSVIYDQAENRMHAQNAILYLLLSDNINIKSEI
ncbi:MAG TPA: ornithine carbamoyltransferase [Spirochaetota bacterium]|nr:ornithine carbamoyltransferase [Spirochaetota bacterium]